MKLESRSVEGDILHTCMKFSKNEVLKRKLRGYMELYYDFINYIVWQNMHLAFENNIFPLGQQKEEQGRVQFCLM